MTVATLIGKDRPNGSGINYLDGGSGNDTVYCMGGADTIVDNDGVRRWVSGPWPHRNPSARPARRSASRNALWSDEIAPQSWRLTSRLRTPLGTEEAT
jgi:Ca2+-binding RTX toxin-like protein